MNRTSTGSCASRGVTLSWCQNCINSIPGQPCRPHRKLGTRLSAMRFSAIPSRQASSTPVADLSGNSTVGPELGWDACAPGGHIEKTCRWLREAASAGVLVNPGMCATLSLKSPTAQKNWMHRSKCINVRSLLDWAMITWTTAMLSQ